MLWMSRRAFEAPKRVVGSCSDGLEFARRHIALLPFLFWRHAVIGGCGSLGEAPSSTAKKNEEETAAAA